ncbi:MAG: hypothetical protein ACLFMP_07575, partial [Desulfonatronovibrionaceae bacterium]
MIFRWLPWRLIAKKTAKAYGTVDPLSLLARLRRFSQPSEVQEPIELIRAGIIFHARGLINTKAIQHNLDWVWPYWVQKQFNPADSSFIPRAFSFSHINLTHRNWTALGTMDDDHYPIIDPRGLITPFFDSWSIDFWLLPPDGETILPSREEQVSQSLEFSSQPEIRTCFDKNGARLESRAYLQTKPGENPSLCMRIATSPPGSRLIMAVRPYNPEGIQFIERIKYRPEHLRLDINRQAGIILPREPEKVLFSEYEKGDVFFRLNEEDGERSVTCRVGMATAAAVFETKKNNAALDFFIPAAAQAGEERPTNLLDLTSD